MNERFEDLDWHDCTIHGFRVEEGGDGCSGQLMLDIDYILESQVLRGDPIRSAKQCLMPSERTK